MHVQVLSSGSRGNATLLRAGERCLLVDAGLSLRALRPRLDEAGVPPRGLDHILVTHAHLDHARSVGALARNHDATVHCALGNMGNRSLARAPRLHALNVGAVHTLSPEPDEQEGDALRYRTVLLPHDCDPTVAYRIEHRGRVCSILTDMGHPRPEVARALAGAHVLLLEFNHDTHMLATGLYPPKLKRRVGGDRGHLSNEQAAQMLHLLAGPELHTLILAHLSEKNNTPDLAREAAQGALAQLGLEQVQVLVASQDVPLANLRV